MNANHEELNARQSQLLLPHENSNSDRGRLDCRKATGQGEETRNASLSVPSHDANEAIAYYKYICAVLKDFPAEGKQHVLETLYEFGLTGHYDQVTTEIGAVTNLFLSHTGRLVQ